MESEPHTEPIDQGEHQVNNEEASKSSSPKEDSATLPLPSVDGSDTAAVLAAGIKDSNPKPSPKKPKKRKPKVPRDVTAPRQPLTGM